MGQRANFIIVEGRTAEIYYDQRGWNKAPDLLIRGLSNCEAWIRKNDAANWLLDNAWAEGGLLIDKDKKIVMLFGELFETGGLRSRFIAYLKNHGWHGWDIRWAHRGNVDFAEHLNIMEDRILAEGSGPDFIPIGDQWKLDPDDREWPIDTLVTIINSNTITDYGFSMYPEIESFIAEGQSIKDKIPNGFIVTDHKTLAETEVADLLLADYDNKKLFIHWSFDVDDRHFATTRELWPGWECHRQTDGLEFLFHYTKREKSYVALDDEEFLGYLGK